MCIRDSAILYADDILLLSRSRLGLQSLFDSVEYELQWLCLNLNFSKSCCIRIGQRFEKSCASIVTSDGSVIRWVDEVRYLGIFLIKARIFRCSLYHAKRAFNRAANCIIGRLGGVNSRNEQVCIQLIKSKCIAILLYGSEACTLNKAQRSSLDFSVVKFAMKILRTSNRLQVINSLLMSNLTLPSVSVDIRYNRFLTKFHASENLLCKEVLLL